MHSRDAATLLLLGAVWGASFLFMRVAVPAFGVLPLVFVRVAGAALVLLPLVLWRGAWPALRAHAGPLAVVGLVNTALPFALYNAATPHLDAGLLGILNATAPLWGMLIAWAWLGERPARMRLLGLAIGFAGVLALVAGQLGQGSQADARALLLASALALTATLCYGFAVNYTRRTLAGAPPLAVAAGSQLAAALFTAIPAWATWPAHTPGLEVWAAAAALAVVCTGWAYLLYFRLIANVGGAQAIAVTFVIPAFAMLWGALFLGEAITPLRTAGAAVVLLGTALATGFIGGRKHT